jgi:putative heme-binding domain-containing protein
LSDPDASIRFHAATALRRVGNSNALPALLSAMTEGDLFARFAMFTTLNHLARAHPELWPRLVRALETRDGFARESIGFALRDTFEIELVKALTQLANDTVRSVPARELALRLLAGVHHRTPPWKGEWWAYHPALSQPPARTVAWAGTALVLRVLRDRLDDANATLRLAAVEGLRTAVDRDSAPRVLQRLSRESNREVRLALIAALGDFADARSAPVIAELLHTEADAELLQAAAETAGKLAASPDTAALLPAALTNLLGSPNLTVETRAATLEALGEFKLAAEANWLVRSAQSEDGRERAAALRGLVRLGGAASLAALRPLLHAESLAVRRDAIAALGRMKQPEAVPDLVSAWRQAGTQAAAIDALAELPDLRAMEPYLAGLESANAALREKCRRAVASIAGEALVWLQQRREKIGPEVLSELRRVYSNDPAALATPLLATAQPALELADYEQFASINAGDPLRGRKIFENLEGVACAKCHVVAGKGGVVGPDLTTIGTQFGRAALIESILHPSKVVREGYQQYAIELDDGEVMSGAVRAESASTLTIADAQGQLHELKKSRIRERRTSALSLMPEGLNTPLTLQEFADLIAYVESLRNDPRREEPRTPK